MNRRRKWMRWLAFLAVLFAFSAATALVLMPASADSRPFSWKIRSNISADYRYGETTASLGAFRISIIGDALRDIGVDDKEASQRENVIKLVMEAAVPTATAFDFEGNPPLTATATNTPTKTATPTFTPTATATNTRIPTRTPTRTDTPKPKATSTAKPPTALVDTQNPIIVASSLSPTPGPSLTGCAITLTVDAKDPAYSAGGNKVEAKHTDPRAPGSYKYFNFTGSGSYDAGENWTGTFAGTINVKGVLATESFEIYFKVWDNAGNHSSWDGPYMYTLASIQDCP